MTNTSDDDTEYSAAEGLGNDDIEMDTIDFGYIRWYRTTFEGAFPAPFDYRMH